MDLSLKQEQMEKEWSGFRALRDQIHKDREECRRMKTETVRLLEEAQETKIRLEKERHAMHAELDVTKRQVVQRWASIETAKKELEEMRQTISDERQAADEYKAKIEADVRQARDEITQMERRFLGLVQDEETLAASWRKVEDAKAEAKQRSLDMQIQGEDLAQEKARCFAVRQELVDEKEEAFQAVQAARQEAEALRRTAERETREWEQAWITYESKVEELQAAQARLEQDRRELELEKRFTQKAQDDAKRNIQDTRNDKFDIQRMWLQVQEQRDALAKEKEEVKKEKEETEKIRQLFEEERAALAEGLRKQREEGDALHRRWEQLEQEKQAAAAAREAEQEQLAQQRKQVEEARQRSIEEGLAEGQQTASKAMEAVWDEGNALFKEREAFDKEREAVEILRQTVQNEQHRVAQQRREMQELYKAQVDDIQDRMLQFDELISKACSLGAVDPDKALALRQEMETRGLQSQHLRKKIFGIIPNMSNLRANPHGGPVVGGLRRRTEPRGA
mmetsp:Transcript_33820/g.60608  ORF Transcript_33820/g.60608 Transcript_33820/m.60608 type:complete len:509 (-) Transcript_33820:179-1705(-)